MLEYPVFPALLKMLPYSVSSRVVQRFANRWQSKYSFLFAKAPLAFARKTHMFDLVIGDIISSSIAFSGFYELALTRKICRLSESGGSFVDVGANMGYFSLLWASANPSCKAICFEVSPRNLSILENNIIRNSLVDRIAVIAKAAGKDVGMINFDNGPVEQTGWGGITTVESNATVSVPLTRLDVELKGMEIDVLKIDVEGADTWVLYGAEDLLRDRKVKVVLFEQNRERMNLLGIPAGDAARFLDDKGYRCSPFNSNRTEWIAVPK